MKYVFIMVMMLMLILSSCSDKLNFEVENEDDEMFELDTLKEISFDITMFGEDTETITIEMSESIEAHYQNNPVDESLNEQDFYKSFFLDNKGDEVFAELISISEHYTGSPIDKLYWIMHLVAEMEYIKDYTFYYPYEVLIHGEGICTDKALVMVKFLKELGYGAAIITFPEEDHMAAGIECKQKQYGDYCILDATSEFMFVTDNSVLDETNISIQDYSVIKIFDGQVYDAINDIETLQRINDDSATVFEIVARVEYLEGIFDELDATCYDMEIPDEYNKLPPKNGFVYNDTGSREYSCQEFLILFNNYIDEYNDIISKGQDLSEWIMQYPTYT